MARINLGKVVPEKGVDYYTEEDKQEIIDETTQKVEEDLNLDDYVKNTDYARNNKGGVIKVSNTNYAITINNDGEIYAASRTYEQYNDLGNNAFIGKGTLENVLTEKIGDIESILEELDIGGGI